MTDHSPTAVLPELEDLDFSRDFSRADGLRFVNLPKPQAALLVAKLFELDICFTSEPWPEDIVRVSVKPDAVAFICRGFQSL